MAEVEFERESLYALLVHLSLAVHEFAVLGGGGLVGDDLGLVGLAQHCLLDEVLLTLGVLGQGQSGRGVLLVDQLDVLGCAHRLILQQPLGCPHQSQQQQLPTCNSQRAQHCHLGKWHFVPIQRENLSNEVLFPQRIFENLDGVCYGIGCMWHIDISYGRAEARGLLPQMCRHAPAEHAAGVLHLQRVLANQIRRVLAHLRCQCPRGQVAWLLRVPIGPQGRPDRLWVAEFDRGVREGLRDGESKEGVLGALHVLAQIGGGEEQQEDRDLQLAQLHQTSYSRPQGQQELIELVDFEFMMGVESGLQYDLEMEWRMTKRMTFVPYPLFKLKQLSEENFMVAIPGAKRINLYDFHLTPSPIALQFSQEMQAIEHLHIQGRQFVFAGLKNGTLEGLELSFEEGQQGSMKLSLAEQAGHQIYINDMLYLGEGRMINCYNSGNIAIWDVSTVQDRQQPVAYLKEVHESFVYKLRRIDQNRIVSCGHDQMANIIDLETTAITDSYYHSESVWCCYPVDENLLCSAGLLGYLQFKDIRIGQTVQALPLLTNETSFVTHLDANHLVFGDRRQVSRCDLRMIVREQQCPKGMKVSAEGILVNGQGGIAVGRGGDLCLFERGEQGPVQETNVRPDNTVFPIMINQFQNIMANFFNMQGMDPNNMHLFDQQSDQEEQQQMDDFQMDSEDDLL